MSIFSKILENVEEPQYVDGIKDFADILKMDGGPYNDFEKEYLKIYDAEQKLIAVKNRLMKTPEKERGDRWKEFKQIDKANKAEI